MTIRSHLETAEESIRQALINALAEKKDTYLTELYETLSKVQDILRTTPVDPKSGDVWIDNSGNISIRTTDKIDEWGERWKQYNFDLTSDYLNNPDVIKFPSSYED